MTDDSTTPKQDPDQERERRRNLALRALVDEMLGLVRDAHRGASLWSPGEREQLERELAEIMSRVRAEALARRSGESTAIADPGAPGGEPRIVGLPTASKRRTPEGGSTG
jgi:hypothetical protein